jgi:hypothetical protein
MERHLRIITPRPSSHKRPTRRGRRPERHGIAAALVFGILALLLDRACDAFKLRGKKHAEALADGSAHIATALAVAFPAATFVEHQKRFLATADD